MTESTHRPSRPGRRMQWLLLLLLLAPLMLALPIPGKPTASNASAVALPIPPPPVVEPDMTSSPVRIASIRPVVGMAINAHHIGDLDLYLDSVDQIADLNANAVIVLTPMWMKRVDSNEILFYPKRCPTNEQLIAILTHAKERGLHTTLLPIVLLETAEPKEWRGVIQPADWDVWWSHYAAMMDRFIGIAKAADVDMLGVGSELNTTEPQREKWERLIAYVRTQYAGELTYSSNWDRFDRCEMWDLVDVMSVSSYFELERDDPQAPHDKLVNAWKRAQRDMLAASRKWNKPLLLSEVGYPTVPWATAHPWDYVPKDGTKPDHDAQARGYRAFFDAWRDVWRRPGTDALGFFCYHWDPYYRGGRKDFGYGVVGKPSFGILREEFAAITGVTLPDSTSPSTSSSPPPAAATTQPN
ncbi:MAG: hypothetical protein KC983_02910 [Phycisphaerales bacterium]|nr:hypothetical protein [Phycisphaerales bacterium]